MVIMKLLWMRGHLPYLLDHAREATLTWIFLGNLRVSNLWNGIYTQNGASVSVKDAGYNATIHAGDDTTPFGLGMMYSGTYGKPTAYTLNGIACALQ